MRIRERVHSESWQTHRPAAIGAWNSSDARALMRRLFLDYQFSGRMARREYWTTTVIRAALGFACLPLLTPDVVDDAALLAIVAAAVVIVINICGLAEASRRLHDSGRSGWWILVSLIPYAGILGLIYLLARKGDPGRQSVRNAPGLGGGSGFGVAAMTAAPMSADQKWAVFAKVDQDCWDNTASSAQGVPIWQLKSGWVRVLFKGAYSTVRVCAGANMDPLLAACFVRPDGIHELRVFSRMRPGAFYDSAWLFGPGADGLPDAIGHAGQRRLSAPLGDGREPVAAANAIWMIDPARSPGTLTEADSNVRIFCPALDETIDVNAGSLNVLHRENQQDRLMRLVPWQRLLGWLLRLRAIDKKAYGRLNKPLRRMLDARDAEQRIAMIGEGDIAACQHQGMLPPYIAWLKPEEVRQVFDSIRLQCSLAGRKDVLESYANLMRLPGYSPIPAILTQIDPARLDVVDLQVLMTIGALRELHGHVEVETQRLLERRPDLRSAMQSPQGSKLLQSDAEYAALKANPLADAEQKDEQDVQVRKGGTYGPTTRELARAGHLMMNIANNQMMTSMFVGGSAAMMVGHDAIDQYIAVALAEGPPWKIYVPYLC